MSPFELVAGEAWLSSREGRGDLSVLLAYRDSDIHYDQDLEAGLVTVGMR